MKLKYRLLFSALTFFLHFLVSENIQSELIENETRDIKENQATKSSGFNSHDLRFITDDFSAALIFHPSRFLHSKLITEIRNSDISLANEELFVFPKLERVMFLYEESLVESIENAGTRRNAPVTLIFKFEEEMNPDNLFDPEIFGQMEDTSQDGLAVKVFSNPGLPEVFHFVNRRTLIATRANLLTKIVDKKSTESLLIKNLRKSKSSYDFVWAADRPLPAWWVMSKVGNICPRLLKPELRLLGQLPYNTKIQGLMGGLNNETLLQITMELENGKEYEGKKQFISDLLMKQNMPKSPQRNPINDAFRSLSIEEQKKLEQSLQDLADETTSSSKGNLFTFSIPKTKLFEQEPELNLIIKSLSARSDLLIKSRNLKEIGLSLHNYFDEFGALPAARGDFQGHRNGLSWRVHVLPFLNHEKLHSQFHLDEPWDSPHNKTLIPQMPKVFASSSVAKEGTSTFHIVEGENTAFPTNNGVRLRDFLDGTSYTIFVIETSPEKAEFWTKPGGLSLNKSEPVKTFGEPYYYGFLTLLVDGSVRTIRGDLLKAENLKALFTRNGGEVVDGF